MGREDASILKSEYLRIFDTCCHNFERDYIHRNEFLPEVTKISEEDIVQYRKSLMLQGYHKYGAVKKNYIFNEYLKPLENLKVRVLKYEETGNQKYLCDAINFAMLAYWQKTKGTMIALQEPEVLACCLNSAMIEMTKCSNDVLDWLDFYKTESDVGYLILIALRLKYELMNPERNKVFYESEVKENTPIVGVSENELKMRS